MGNSASQPNDRHSLYVAGLTPLIPLENIRQQDERIKIPAGARTTHRARPDRGLKKLSIFLAILIGCAITAGTTYALARDIQRGIANSSGAVYDACYYGCNGCKNPRYDYVACAKTAEVNITGVICDGNIMWNWKDRYPVACLEAMADIYKRSMFRNAKREHLQRLAILVLIVLAGIVGGAITQGVFWYWVKAHRKKKAIKARQKSVGWPRAKPYDQPPPPPLTTWESNTALSSKTPKTGLTSSPKTSNKTARRSLRWGKLSVATLAALPGRVAAFPCIDFDPSVNQYFVDANRTTFGVVRGWISNCRRTKCSTYSNVSPQEYVDNILPSVIDCGFELADAVEGNTNLRIANALIELEWRVEIGVNGYNLSSSTETDESIQCLHDISKSNN
ncbi:hypothetical protein V493_06414 [Pseudogymnoascus sp. VKM F-4281 (FW-2241)]|nr:hypothetical protein V493_06414 [Pseudogymnoascus sp. VKM F-4281 (FW-2241)]